MEFKDIVMKRYATKKFDGRILPDEKINELFEIIRYSPSSLGLQPYRIKVIKDIETKEKLLSASNNQTQVTTCSHLLVFCADTNVMERISVYEQMIIKNGTDPFKAKEIINHRRAFVEKSSSDKLLSWAQNQVYIALGNAVNGAKSLGFDSCPMGGFKPEEYSRILELPQNLVPTVICPIGYATDTPREKIRFENKELFF